MIPVFPERPLPLLANIVLLSSSPCYQLQAFRDNLLASIDNKQMNMIRCDDVIKNTETVPLFCLIKPMASTLSIFFKFKKELLLMASMGNVPNTTQNVVSVGSWHIKQIFIKGK